MVGFTFEEYHSGCNMETQGEGIRGRLVKQNCCDNTGDKWSGLLSGGGTVEGQKWMQLRKSLGLESQDFLLTVKGEKKRTVKNEAQVSA